MVFVGGVGFVYHRSIGARGHVRTDDVIELTAMGLNEFPMTPYPTVPACPDDGGVCICKRDNQPLIPKASQAVSCQSWKYQVGDIVIFSKPNWDYWHQAQIF